MEEGRWKMEDGWLWAAILFVIFDGFAYTKIFNLDTLTSKALLAMTHCCETAIASHLGDIFYIRCYVVIVRSIE